MADEKPLPTEILEDLGENGGPVSFRTFEDVYRWAQKELDAWAPVFRPDAVPEEFRAAARLQTAVPQDLQKLVRDGAPNRQDFDSQMSALFSRYKASSAIHSTSVWADRIRVLAQANQIEAAAVAWALPISVNERAGRPTRELNNHYWHVWGGTIARAFARVGLATDGWPDDVAARERALDLRQARLSELETQWQQRLVGVDRQMKSQDAEFVKASKLRSDGFGDFAGAAFRRAEQIFGEGIQRIAALEQVFNEKIRLEAPVRYWKAKVKTHGEAALGWGIAASVVSLGPIIILAEYATQANRWFLSVGKDISAGAVALLLIFAVLYLAFGRMIFRLFSTNLALKNDASERVVMAQTFLALVHRKKVAESERMLILAALFRPHAITQDDGPAGVADMISKLMQPRP